MVDAVSTTAATSRTTSGRTSLISNYETFLQLLTSQLKNQDPLSPMDSTAFTEQLTQMSGVEQQLLTNELLTSLLEAQKSGDLSGASGYLGKDVTAVWSATRLDGGKANWNYELGAGASEATLSVLDGSGKTVWTGPAPNKSAGTHAFVWDGKTTAGGQLPDGGVYSLKITAKAGPKDVSAQVLTAGRVTGVEMANGVPYLTIGNSLVPLSAVIGVKDYVASPTSPPTTPAGTT